MAGILASMLAGGAEGGLDKYGEVVEDRITKTREDEKAAALEQRNMNIRKLNQKYQTSERVAGQEFRKAQSGSGQYSAGRELTKEELSQLSDNDKKGILSTGAYQEGVESKELNKEIAKEKRLQGYKMEQLGAKPKSEASKKSQAKGAFQDVSAKLISLGGMQDVENNRQFVFDASKMQKEKQDQILSYLDSSGFTIEGSLDPDSGLFQINLGQFDPKRVSSFSASKPKETDEDKAKNDFDSMLELMESQGNKEVIEEPANLDPEQTGDENKSNGILSQRLAPTRDIIESGKKALKPVGDKMTEFVKKWQR